MASNVVSKKTILRKSGDIIIEVRLNGELYATLVSDVFPKSMADFKMFNSYLFGETSVVSSEDHVPFEQRRQIGSEE